jgi:hypothetical protein
MNSKTVIDHLLIVKEIECRFQLSLLHEIQGNRIRHGTFCMIFVEGFFLGEEVYPAWRG